MDEKKEEEKEEAVGFGTIIKLQFKIIYFNRYRRKRPKMDASIFDLVLSHTRRSDASEKREENTVSTFGRFRLWTSFESSSVSVNFKTFSLIFELIKVE